MELDLRGCFRIVWRRRRPISLIFAAAIFASFVSSKMVKPVYRAGAKIMVAQTLADDLVNLFDAMAKSSRSRPQNFVEFLKGDELARRAAELMEPGTGLEGEASPFPRKGLAVQVLPTTDVISISIESTDARQAADAANALAMAFKEWAEEENRSQSGEVWKLDVRLVNRAVTPSKPIKPRTGLNMAVAGFLALFTGCILAFLLEYVDSTIKTVSDAKKHLKLPVLGSIPAESARSSRATRHGREKGRPFGRLAALGPPGSPVYEAYRALRTALQSGAQGQPLRTLLLTGAGPEAGTSTVIANLAATLAQAGKRVTLVDANFRRPALHEFFGIGPDEGLSDILTGGTSHFAVLKKVDVDNLLVLTCGSPSHSPFELLGSTPMLNLLDKLRQESDYVLIDCPPAAAFADASALADRVDAAILVLNSGVTPQQTAADACEQLLKVNCRLLGVVLNNVSLNRDVELQYAYYAQHERRAGGASHGRVAGSNSTDAS